MQTVPLRQRPGRQLSQNTPEARVYVILRSKGQDILYQNSDYLYHLKKKEKKRPWSWTHRR